MPQAGPGIEPVNQVHALAWELNLELFGAQADTLTIVQHWPWLNIVLICIFLKCELIVFLYV